MASGRDVIGKIQTVNFTGTFSSITSHDSRGMYITSSSVKINSGTAQSYANAVGYLSDYYVLIRDAVLGQQHCLLSRITPNDSVLVAAWNQNDNAQTPSYTVNGVLIPKAACPTAP